MATTEVALPDTNSQVRNEVTSSDAPVSRKICAICKDNATGVHFGVMTCEGCKGFFRRSVKKNASFKCSFENSCEITKYSRKHCQACRLQACLNAGMRSDLVLSDEDVNKKRELIKLNREKRAEKQRLKKNNLEQERLKKVAEIENSNSIQMTIEEKLLLDNLLKSHEVSYDFGYKEYDTFRGKEKISSPDEQATTNKDTLAWLVAPLSKENCDKATSKENITITDLRNSVAIHPQRTPTVRTQNVTPVQDNLDIFSSLHGISDKTKESPISSKLQHDSHDVNSTLAGNCFSSSQVNFASLNDSLDSLDYLHDLLKSQGLSFALEEDSNSKQLLQHFCDIMTWGIKKVIEFCKHIPQFGLLSLGDQIVLLKSGCLEMLVLRSYFAFSSSDNKYMSDKFQYRPSDFLQAGGSKEFVENYNNLHLRMRKMKLQVEEICLLLALVLFSPDRPGLEEQEAVEKMQDKVARTLYAYEHVHKPIKEAKTIYCEILLILPILRTINMLFSTTISSLQETNESDMNPLIFEVNSSANVTEK